MCQVHLLHTVSLDSSDPSAQSLVPSHVYAFGMHSPVVHWYSDAPHAESVNDMCKLLVFIHMWLKYDQ